MMRIANHVGPRQSHVITLIEQLFPLPMTLKTDHMINQLPNQNTFGGIYHYDDINLSNELCNISSQSNE